MTSLREDDTPEFARVLKNDPDDPSPVDQELTKLQQDIGSVHNLLGSLEQRIMPALSADTASETSNPEGASVNVVSSNSQLFETVRGIDRKILLLHDRLINLIDRVQI